MVVFEYEGIHGKSWVNSTGETVAFSIFITSVSELNETHNNKAALLKIEIFWLSESGTAVGMGVGGRMKRVSP